MNMHVAEKVIVDELNSDLHLATECREWDEPISDVVAMLSIVSDLVDGLSRYRTALGGPIQIDRHIHEQLSFAANHAERMAAAFHDRYNAAAYPGNLKAGDADGEAVSGRNVPKP